MFTFLKKEEAPSLWTHNSNECGLPSANNITSKGSEYQSQMMNHNPMKNFMFDRYFGIDEMTKTHNGMNFFVLGDEKRDVADRIFRHQIEQVKSSFVVSTTSQVLFGMTRGHLAKNGYTIKVLNFTETDELSNLSNKVEQSYYFGVFSQAETPDEVDSLVKTMIKMSKSKINENAFFYEIMRNLIASAVLLLQINKKADIKEVIKLVESAELKTNGEKEKGKSFFDSKMEEGLLFQNVGSDKNKTNTLAAYERYKSFKRNSGQSRNYIVQNAVEILKKYDCVSKSKRDVSYNFDEFANKKFALFIIMDDKESNRELLGRVITQEIIYQFDAKHSGPNSIRFMVEGVDKYLTVANFVPIVKNKGRHMFTTVMHNMDNLSQLEKKQIDTLDESADVVIYMGAQKKTDANHIFAMEKLSKQQKESQLWKKVVKHAKKDMKNRSCVYSPEDKLDFDMSSNEQIVFVKGYAPFLVPTVY